MVNELLTAAGIPERRGRFTGAKPATYAVVMDNIDSEPGPDPVPGAPPMLRHDVIVELYEDRPDDAAEAALEAVISAAGLHWTKQDRYWLQAEQQYQVVYEFTYYERRRT